MLENHQKRHYQGVIVCMINKMICGSSIERHEMPDVSKLFNYISHFFATLTLEILG